MYYKFEANGYIICIGTGGMGAEITEEEYLQIQNAMEKKPPKTETTDYRLKSDLTWEVYEVEPEEPDDTVTDIDKAEAYDILTGVSE